LAALMGIKDVEGALRENLRLRRDLMAEVTRASEPITFGQKVRKWWSAHFGRSEDQPVFFALLVVAIAIIIYAFL
jgi:hypothetical protein